MKCLNEAGTTESGLISILFKLSNFNAEIIYHLKFENKQITYNSEYIQVCYLFNKKYFDSNELVFNLCSDVK